MGLCLPRRRRATSLATRPRTLSVASITNHSCTTSAGLALKVFMGRFACLCSPMHGDDRYRFGSWRPLTRSFPGAKFGKAFDYSRVVHFHFVLRRNILGAFPSQNA